MMRREVERFQMSQQVSGKLLLRVRGGKVSSSRNRFSASEELVCKVEFDGKSATCFSSITAQSECLASARDATLDVAEYHGASPVTISVFIKRSRGGLTKRRGSRMAQLLVAKLPVPKSQSSNHQRSVGTPLTVPLRQALPKLHRNLARQVADAYDNGCARVSLTSSLGRAAAVQSSLSESSSAHGATLFLASAALEAGWWNAYGERAPENWQDYWPSIMIPLGSSKGANEDVLEVSLLFVPFISPERSYGGFTELHKAAYIGDSRLVSALLQPRCHTNIHYRTRDALGLTALDIAALKGNLEVGLEICADSSHIPGHFHHQSTLDKRTSLHYAVLGGNPMIVSCLADHFSNNHVVAVVKRSGSVVSSLGANEDDEDEEETQRCPLIDVQDVNGWTATMMAAGRADMVPAVSRLVESGADLELVSKSGDTALIIACREGNIACAIELLKARGTNQPPESKASMARPNRANYAGDRALDRAAKAKSCPELILALLEAFAVPALRRADGSTALHVAAEAGLGDNCRAMIEWLEREKQSMANAVGSLGQFVGSSVAQSLHLVLIKDYRGRLASDAAKEAGYLELAKWLSEAEAKELAMIGRDSMELNGDHTYDYYQAKDGESADEADSDEAEEEKHAAS